MKNFKECKETFNNYTNHIISQEEFNNWSKTNCENCKLWIGKSNNKHCIFGKPKNIS